MRQFLANSLFEIAVRARKSPWIETDIGRSREKPIGSGLVRARGLKPFTTIPVTANSVRARKSPRIETMPSITRSS